MNCQSLRSWKRSLSRQRIRAKRRHIGLDWRGWALRAWEKRKKQRQPGSPARFPRALSLAAGQGAALEDSLRPLRGDADNPPDPPPPPRGNAKESGRSGKAAFCALTRNTFRALTNCRFLDVARTRLCEDACDALACAQRSPSILSWVPISHHVYI